MVMLMYVPRLRDQSRMETKRESESDRERVIFFKAKQRRGRDLTSLLHVIKKTPKALCMRV